MGQSIWLNYVRRDRIASGGHLRLIESHDSDEDFLSMALTAIYETFSHRDVQIATGELRPARSGR